MPPGEGSCSLCLPGTDQASACIDWDSRKNEMDMLHPIIFPALSNISVRLARKMQSGVRRRVAPRQHPNRTPSNRQGSVSYLIYSRAA